jgi:hypothetical protein
MFCSGGLCCCLLPLSSQASVLVGAVRTALDEHEGRSPPRAVEADEEPHKQEGQIKRACGTKFV